jgi:hypothetical protein
MGDEGLHSLGVSLGRGLLRVTNQERSGPNASSPSGPANGRDANPDRSLGGQALLRGRLRIKPGLPWPGQAERLGPRHWSALPGRRVSLSSCAFRPPSRTGGPNGARERLTQPKRANWSGVLRLTGRFKVRGAGERGWAQQTRPLSRTRPAHTAPVRETAIRAGGPGLAHEGIGDCPSGASRSRINCARWRRRWASAGPAVVSSTATPSSNRALSRPPRVVHSRFVCFGF